MKCISNKEFIPQNLFSTKIYSLTNPTSSIGKQSTFGTAKHVPTKESIPTNLNFNLVCLSTSRLPYLNSFERLETDFGLFEMKLDRPEFCFHMHH